MHKIHRTFHAVRCQSGPIVFQQLASVVFLQGFKTLLTDSEDSSFLFNTILDAVVDRALPVTQVGQQTRATWI